MRRSSTDHSSSGIHLSLSVSLFSSANQIVMGWSAFVSCAIVHIRWRNGPPPSPFMYSCLDVHIRPSVAWPQIPVSTVLTLCGMPSSGYCMSHLLTHSQAFDTFAQAPIQAIVTHPEHDMLYLKDIMFGGFSQMELQVLVDTVITNAPPSGFMVCEM
jgi:hypothetical protein